MAELTSILLVCYHSISVYVWQSIALRNPQYLRHTGLISSAKQRHMTAAHKSIVKKIHDKASLLHPRSRSSHVHPSCMVRSCYLGHSHVGLASLMAAPGTAAARTSVSQSLRDQRKTVHRHCKRRHQPPPRSSALNHLGHLWRKRGIRSTHRRPVTPLPPHESTLTLLALVSRNKRDC